VKYHLEKIKFFIFRVKSKKTRGEIGGKVDKVEIKWRKQGPLGGGSVCEKTKKREILVILPERKEGVDREKGGGGTNKSQTQGEGVEGGGVKFLLWGGDVLTRGLRICGRG